MAGRDTLFRFKETDSILNYNQHILAVECYPSGHGARAYVVSRELKLLFTRYFRSQRMAEQWAQSYINHRQRVMKL